MLHRSLIANNSGVIARGRLRLLRRAVDCFGFHLASLDIRQNSAVHERTIAELIDAAMPGTSYLALGEDARIALLTSELRNARPLASPFVKYSDETMGELALFHAAAEAHAKFGADAIPQCIISMCKGISDMLEVAVLLKEVGLVDPSGRSAINIVPLFETIEDLQASQRIMDRMLSLHDYRRWSTAAAACRKSCSAIPTATRTAASSPRAGSCTRPRSASSRCSSAITCGCGCSTAAAARSAAAAARAMTPSSRSPAAR